MYRPQFDEIGKHLANVRHSRTYVAMINLEQVTKSYAKNGAEVYALREVTLEILPGEFLAVRGPSGSGKTTLLLTVAGLLRPTAGKVRHGERDLYALSRGQRVEWRAAEIGFVFQMFHLVPYLSVLDNVLLAGPIPAPRETAVRMLEELGLSGRLKHRPAELSAGECQRTALARALVRSPKLILADEPTGNLDPDNAETVMRRLKQFQADGGTVIVVTHSDDHDRYADRVVRLEAGQLVDNGDGTTGKTGG